MGREGGELGLLVAAAREKWKEREREERHLPQRSIHLSPSSRKEKGDLHHLHD